MTAISIAIAQYAIQPLSSWGDIETHLNQWMQALIDKKPDLVVFPEYAGLQLASCTDNPSALLSTLFDGLQAYLPRYQMLWQQWAQQLNTTIVAGSLPVKQDTTFVNRAYIIAPDGTLSYQDKALMTCFEKDTTLITGSTEQRVFTLPWGTMGIAICYDSEFPLVVRRLVEAGADVIVVPSCTDSMAGYHRVASSCIARALENQCAVLQAPLVGNVPWLSFIDVNVGQAGVFVPMDGELPDNGIIMQGRWNEVTWVFSTLNLAPVRHTRTHGQVRNHTDWSQSAHSTQPIKTVVWN